MSKKTIDRDVTHQGPRLQKLRALIKLLEIHILNKGKDGIHFYFGIESQGDTIVKTIEGKVESSYHEEDKNYNPESTFTINSPEIRKCLVGFIDTWFKQELSDNCHFTFYATNGFTKERRTKLIKELKIQLPDKALLELLQEEKLDDDTIKILSELTVAFYEEEYKSEKNSGNLIELQKFTQELWEDFFSRIHFGFGEPDHTILKDKALTLIQECKFYNSTHSGKEEQILSLALELLEEYHDSDDPTENLIHVAQLENIFFRVTENEPGKQIDMIYKQWDAVEADLSDSRNIREKMRFASNSISEERIISSTRRASTGLLEKDEYDYIKNFQSMRYRIYELCHEEIRKYVVENEKSSFDDDEYDKLHDYLSAEAHKEILELSSDFVYSFNNKRIIDGVIYQLVDSCFLSYDKFKKS